MNMRGYPIGEYSCCRPPGYSIFRDIDIRDKDVPAAQDRTAKSARPRSLEQGRFVTLKRAGVWALEVGRGVGITPAF